MATIWLIGKGLLLSVFGWITVVAAINYCILRVTTRSHPNGEAALIFAFTSLGGVIGLAVGASRTPVIGTVVPAVITFVSASLAYLFSRDTLEKWRPVIPYCITTLCIGMTLPLFLGSDIRLQAETSDKKYQEWRLHYERVQLEVARAQYLRMLAAGQLDNQLMDKMATVQDTAARDP